MRNACPVHAWPSTIDTSYLEEELHQEPFIPLDSPSVVYEQDMLAVVKQADEMDKEISSLLAVDVEGGLDRVMEAA